jgi:hypothetical protein
VVTGMTAAAAVADGGLVRNITWLGLPDNSPTPFAVGTSCLSQHSMRADLAGITTHHYNFTAPEVQAQAIQKRVQLTALCLA